MGWLTDHLGFRRVRVIKSTTFSPAKILQKNPIYGDSSAASQGTTIKVVTAVVVSIRGASPADTCRANQVPAAVQGLDPGATGRTRIHATQLFGGPGAGLSESLRTDTVEGCQCDWPPNILAIR